MVILVKNKKDINEIDLNLTIAQDFFKIKATNDPNNFNGGLIFVREKGDSSFISPTDFYEVDSNCRVHGRISYNN